MRRPNNGMRCPKCGVYDSRVGLTKRTEDGVSIRRRICRQCDFRWYTGQEPEYLVRVGRDFKFYGLKSGRWITLLNHEVEA